MRLGLCSRRAACVGAGLLAATLTAGGCGGEDWKAAAYPARGELIVNGQPAAGAFVTLYPVDKPVDVRESRPWGMVGDDGVYRLRTYEPGDGAPAGEYRVGIVWRFDPKAQAETDRLGFAYAKPEKNPWRVTIQKGDNELPRIELTDVKLRTAPPRRPARPSPLDEQQ